MKVTILIAFLAMSVAAQATSTSPFKTIMRCETVQKVKGSEMIVEVEELPFAKVAQNRLVIRPSGQQAEILNVKTILPPRMMAGAPVKYVGKDRGTDNNITLAVYSTRIAVGKVFGRSAKFTVENVFKDLAMVCVAK